MAQIEERQAKIEGILEQIDKRLTRVETEIKDLYNKMDSDISGLHNKMDSNFKWQIGIMLTMWVTIIIAVLKKG